MARKKADDLKGAQRTRAVAAALALIDVVDPDGRLDPEAALLRALDPFNAALRARGKRATTKTTTAVTATTPAIARGPMARHHDIAMRLIDPWPDADFPLHPCTRRVLLKDEADLTLLDLHSTIQAAFGWSQYHLATFNDAPDSDTTIAQLIEDDEGRDRSPVFEKVRLSLVARRGNVLFYNYDFGDDWWVRIDFNGVVEHAASARRTLVDAEGTAPPEDCGGVIGFLELCDARARQRAGQPLTDEDTERLQWAGEAFSADFDVLALRQTFDR